MLGQLSEKLRYHMLIFERASINHKLASNPQILLRKIRKIRKERLENPSPKRPTIILAKHLEGKQGFLLGASWLNKTERDYCTSTNCNTYTFDAEIMALAVVKLLNR